MKNYILNISCSLALFLTISFPADFLALAATTSTPEELEREIQARTQRLESINKELETTQNTLKEIQGQKSSLTKELKSLDYSVKQLNLNIQSDDVTSQKLGFEIDGLQYDIRDIEDSVADKKEAIGDLMRELQRNDQNNLLMILLQNAKLTETLTEAQNLGTIRSQLTIDIAELRVLSEGYESKLNNVEEKRSEVLVRQENLKNRKLIVEDKKAERESILTVTKNKEGVYEKQLQELRGQQDSISDEIAEFEKKLRESFNPNLLPAKRLGVFEWPVIGGQKKITQHFGTISSLYRGKPHNGLDIGVPVGTPIIAAEDGVVFAVDDNDKSRLKKYQYGKYVLLKHDNNLATLYGHLSRQIVREGDRVRRGQIIGYSGNTGYSTGPHLHLGLYWSPSITMKSVPPSVGLIPVGVVIDPEDYL
ncbi:MAG: peptidoglycan DD-metalloendopeptidase family protein [Patescibacteria group bacterium]